MSLPPPAAIGCLLNALQCGAALVDRAHTLVHANARLAEMSGRSAEAMAGRPLAELYREPAALERLSDMLAAFDEPAEGEFHLERPDGGRVPIIFAARPLRIAGQDGPPAFRVVTIIEITQQKEAYAEVAKLGDTVIAQALELRQLNETLEQRVAERTAELHTANMEAIRMLAVASEARDEDTGDHINRIECYAGRLARAAGVDEEQAKRIAYSAILHDVGKIQIPDGILKKPGPLTDDERRAMQQHTLIGQRILSAQPFFETARLIARSHHENWDGSGYPDHLAKLDIPLPARITHLVDVFDALVSKRAYKHAWPADQAAAEIDRTAGTMFDPDLARAFLRLYEAGDLGDLLDDAH